MFRNFILPALLAAAACTLFVATSHAGAVNGPQDRKGTLAPNDPQDTFTIRFKGGEQALIIVNNTSNKGDIDLRVEDDNGRVVAKDFKKNDDASVTFTPKKTGTFYVKVKYFRGPGKLNYKLSTN